MASPAFFLVALLLVASNLRTSLTGVGPLLPAIRADLGLSATLAGLLSSLPLLMFAVFAPLARFGRQFGNERLVLVGMLALLGGILLRSAGGVVALFAGTATLAAAIAMVNVLIPAIVKDHYPTRVPAITSAYATVFQVFASTASGVAVPLALHLNGGWRASLACAVIPLALAIVCWVPQLGAGAATVTAGKVAAAAVADSPPRLWRRALAWQVTLFMGFQSTLFYVAISWYPAYLGEMGYSATAAGSLLTIYQVAALLAGMAVTLLIRRLEDQRLIAAGVAALAFIATAGLLFAPDRATLWVIVLGIGAGPSLVLSLSFFGLRTGSVVTAAALSLMAQGIGYFIAMFGPLAFGLLHDLTGGWRASLLYVMAMAVGQGICGLAAGRKTVLD